MRGKNKNNDNRTPEQQSRGQAPKTERYQSWYATATVTVIFGNGERLTFTENWQAQDKQTAERRAKLELQKQVEKRCSPQIWRSHLPQVKVTFQRL